jgi:AcrR family transcriptional regulator
VTSAGTGPQLRPTGAVQASQRSQSGRARRAGRAARTGRRAGDSGTREAILDSARVQFAERGYNGATIRAIALSAGVDPALVHHFYGTKERLFTAAMQLPLVPGEAITAALAEIPREPGTSAGEHLVRSALALWDSSDVRAAFIGLLRSALTSDQAAVMLREFVTAAILRPVASIAADSDPERIPFRVALVGSHMLGLALTRYVLQLGPVAAADADALAAAIGPVIDRYLTGDIGGTAGR